MITYSPWYPFLLTSLVTIGGLIAALVRASFRIAIQIKELRDSVELVQNIMVTYFDAQSGQLKRQSDLEKRVTVLEAKSGQ